jgi:hypothetical protein
MISIDEGVWKMSGAHSAAWSLGEGWNWAVSVESLMAVVEDLPPVITTET